MDAMTQDFDIEQWVTNIIREYEKTIDNVGYIVELARKSILYNKWEAVHKLKPIFDFDSTQSAEELIQDLDNILKTFNNDKF